MTDIGEGIAVAMGEKAAEASSPCWFCEEGSPSKKLKNIEKADPDTSDSELAELVPENHENNDSSALGESLGNAPKWIIKNPLNESKSTSITPGAHHCIPGGASLAKATNLHKFMREGDHYSSDIGYDVNHENNGIWLPGNYAVREDSAEFNNLTWSAQLTTFKNKYVKSAVDEAGGRQFHDSHRKYNRLCKKSLLALAAKLQLPEDEKCPICDKKKVAKDRPPFGLVGRLDRLSGEYRKMLKTPTRKTIQAGFYTSNRMKGLYP